MKPRETKSVFASVYALIFLIVAILLVGLVATVKIYAIPQLASSRADAIQSIIRSHDSDILINRIRALRDELVNSGVIQDDRAFQHYFPEDRDQVATLLRDCKFISPTICLNSQRSIFIEPATSALPTEGFKYAIAVDASLLTPPIAFVATVAMVTIFIFVGFLVLFRAIRRKEAYLIERVSLTTEALQNVENSFRPEGNAKDEFHAIEMSVDELVKSLKESQKSIEEYKTKFERTTRLEQLGLTVGQVSHDLKAPLNEAENFLTSLPRLLEKVPRDQILSATESLILRIRAGKIALTQALQATKHAAVARETLGLREILINVTNRAKESEKLRALSFSMELEEGHRTLGDRLRFETAILNLLENTADEKNDAHVRMTLSSLPSGGAKITYKDNGGGIPDEFLEKIFEPLVTYKATGFGLGLSSTKEILAQHGGQIRAIPHQGGANFEIVVPVVGGANA